MRSPCPRSPSQEWVTPHANAPYTVIQRTIHIHPTVTELIHRLLLHNSSFLILTLLMLGELKPLE
jgi:hypothetical protein